MASPALWISMPSSPPSSLTTTIDEPSPTHVASRYRTPSGRPCWRTASSHRGIVKSFPRVSEGDGMAGGVQGEVAEVTVGGHELAVALHPGAVQVDLDPVPLVGGGVVDPDLGGVLVDDPAAVGLGEAGVVLVVVGVATQVGAVGLGRVEVADSLVVGQEPDPRSPIHIGEAGLPGRRRAAELAVPLAGRSTGRRPCRPGSASSGPGRRCCGRGRPVSSRVSRSARSRSPGSARRAAAPPARLRARRRRRGSCGRTAARLPR